MAITNDRRSVRSIAVASAAALFSAVLFNEYCEYHGGLLSDRIDYALFVCVVLLKPVCFVSTAVLFLRWFQSARGSGWSCFLQLAPSVIAVVVLTVALAVSRDHWAGVLSNESEKYHTFSDGGGEYARMDASAYKRLSSLWRSGVIPIAECFVLVALFAVLAFFAAMSSSPARARLTGAVITSLFALWTYVSTSRFTSFTFDLFHGDIWSFAVAWDLVFPLPTSPYSLIASAYYLTALAPFALLTYARTINSKKLAETAR